MHVLHAIHDFLPRHQAGSELYALRLARAQMERHDVTVLCADFDPSGEHGHVHWRVHDGVPVVEIINNWRCASFEETYRSRLMHDRIRHVLQTLRPDVVHVHNLLNLSFDLPAIAKALGVPVVATLHDYTLLCASGGQRVHKQDRHVCVDIDTNRCARCFTQSVFYENTTFGSVVNAGVAGRAIGRMAVRARRLMPVLTARAAKVARHAGRLEVHASDIDARMAAARRVFEDVDLFVAPSASLAREFERFGLPPDRLRVSDYGMPDWPARPARAPGRPLRIGLVGTLVWHKGAHVLIDALRSLPPDGYRATIFGSTDIFPDYAAELRARATGLPIEFSGAFPPDRAPAVYAGIDVLVVPSLWPENSPLVIHEAFQAGVAVVGSRIGGIPDLLEDGVSGLLFESGFVADLARALQQLIDDPSRAGVLAAAAPRVKTMAEDAAAWDDAYAEIATNLKRKQSATVMSASHLSVVLPTHNGAETLPALLHSLRSQRTLGAVEIIAVDSGSSDGTVELLNDAAVTVIRIGEREFDHGTTRNLAIARTHGEFVVLLVQDALLIGDNWLETLVKPFTKDPILAATFARQRPRPGASALTRHYFDRWIASSTEGWRVDLEGGQTQFDGMTPAERLRLCTFDNVASCIRRSVWEKHPFKETPIAEDLEWAKEVLLGGYALRFVPDAIVEHSHERSAAYEYARTRLLHARLYDLFGLETIPTAPALARAMLSSMARHLLVEWRSPSRWLRAAALAVAWPLGQYRGARLARSGDVRPPARPGKV